MEFDNTNPFSDGEFDDSIDLKNLLEKYLVHWKWFVFTVILFPILVYFYLNRQVPQYFVSASILVKEKEKGSSVNNLEAFEDLGIFGSNNNSVENEIYILTSRRLIKKVVTELKFNVKYFIESSPYNKEYYPNFPLILEFPKETVGNSIEEEGILNVNYSFTINVVSNSKFEYFDVEGNSIGFKEFGKEFETDFGKIVIKLNDSWEGDLLGENIIVTINRMDVIVNQYRNKVVVAPLDDKSRVVGLSINETSMHKGVAFINNLVEQYNADAIDDKNQVHIKTTEFLNDRIILITSELNAIENTVEKFKRTKGYIDPNAGSGIILQSSSANENETIAASTQLQLAEYMIEQVGATSNSDLLPVNIGLSDPAVLNLIVAYNELVIQRNRILKSSTTRNPLIVALDSQISNLRNNLNSSLNTIKSSLNIQIGSLNTQTGRINSRIASVPKNEMEYKDIVRQLETKNAVYLYLLQKREESILSNAITINKARVVDNAYTSGSPVYPKPTIAYIGGILLGFILPIGFIYIKQILDTKIHDENDIKKLKIPYLGDVPLISSKNNLYITDYDNTPIAEAFRYLRTNINFMLDRKDMGKTVFVTSTQSHEGKTFASINLANSLAIGGKRTLLIGLDLRAPKIAKYLKVEKGIGMSNFITDNSLGVEDVIETNTKLKNLHIIDSGDVPPNPVELLMSRRVSDVFDYAKENYEFVIVDTAPVGMVTDTIQISHLADLTIYVIKANYLDKRMLHIPASLNQSKKLKNMAILINGTDQNRTSYGYGYGYGKVKKKKSSWFNFF